MNTLDQQRLFECIELLNNILYNQNSDYYSIINKEAQIWKTRFYELVDSIESMRDSAESLYEGYKTAELSEHALEAEAYLHAFNVVVDHIHEHFNHEQR